MMFSFSESLHTSRFGNCGLKHTHVPDVAAVLFIGVRGEAAVRVYGSPCTPTGKWTGLVGRWEIPD